MGGHYNQVTGAVGLAGLVLRTLPGDVTAVTYDLQDLSPGGQGLMINGKYSHGAGRAQLCLLLRHDFRVF